MYSEEKVKQVFNAIKENGLKAFNDDSLAKLLSILNSNELDMFESMCYEELNGMEGLKRIMDIRPYVDLIINRDLYRIKMSSVYKSYLDSLKAGEYKEYFKTLNGEELADLKKYVSFTANKEDEVNISGSKKIVNMLTREIKNRDEARKPRLEEQAA